MRNSANGFALSVQGTNRSPGLHWDHLLLPRPGVGVRDLIPWGVGHFSMRNPGQISVRNYTQAPELPPEGWSLVPRIAQREGANAHHGLEFLGGRSRTGGRADRHGPPDPTAPGPRVTAGSGEPRGSGSPRAPAPESTGKRPDRPFAPTRSQSLRSPFGPRSSEVLRRDNDTPERPRNRDGAVGRVVVERDVDPAGSTEQRQPRRLPVPGPVEPHAPVSRSRRRAQTGCPGSLRRGLRTVARHRRHCTDGGSGPAG